jgi:hypothetical protein
MNIPNQSTPIIRGGMTINTAFDGIFISDCCPNGGKCVGTCILNRSPYGYSPDSSRCNGYCDYSF